MKASTITADYEKLLTITQVSEITDIPVSALRKYCSKFRQNLDLKRGDNNTLLFNRATLNHLVLARKLFSEGLPAHEVKKRLFEVVKLEPQSKNKQQEPAGTKEPGSLPPFDRLNPLSPFERVPHEYKPIVKLFEEQKAKISELAEAQEQQKSRIAELEKTIAEMNRPRSLREIIFEFLQAIKAIHQK